MRTFIRGVLGLSLLGSLFYGTQVTADTFTILMRNLDGSPIIPSPMDPESITFQAFKQQRNLNDVISGPPSQINLDPQNFIPISLLPERIIDGTLAFTFVLDANNPNVTGGVTNAERTFFLKISRDGIVTAIIPFLTVQNDNLGNHKIMVAVPRAASASADENKKCGCCEVHNKASYLGTNSCSTRRERRKRCK